MSCNQEEEGGGVVNCTSSTPPILKTRAAVIQKTTRHAKKSPTLIEGPTSSKQTRRFQCTVENCGYVTPLSKDLTRHMRKHTGEKPFKCDQCGKCYSRNDKLTLHLRLHQNKKPFTCTSCDYASVDAHSLTKHLRVHSDERPYKCQVCQYSAKESSQLVVHLRSHTGDCPYTCLIPNCNSAFKTISDLKRHLNSRLHSDEKPYSCPHCKHRASVKCNLTSHIRKVHKDLLVANDEGQSKRRTVAKVHIISNTNEGKDLLVKTEQTEEQPYVSNVCGEEECMSIQRQEEHEKGVVSLQVALGESNIVSSSSQESETTGPSKRGQDDGQLSFEYACKQCSFRAPSYRRFDAHLKKVHGSNSSILSPNLIAQEQVDQPLQHKRRVGRPSRRLLRSEVMETFYDCNFCSASFVRKDSLRCHLRQHSTPNILNSTPETISAAASFQTGPQFLNFLAVTTPSPPSIDGLFTSNYPNLNFNATTTTIEAKGNEDGGPIPNSVIIENPTHQVYFLRTGDLMNDVNVVNTGES